MPATKPSKAPQKSSPQKSSKKGRTRWVVLGILLAAVCASVYFITRPAAPEPETSLPAIATAPTTLPSRHIYSETADPKADIAAALAVARRDHKRVLVDFGGDWCGDCQVLDIYFHQPPNADLLAQNFVLVHVWIGHMDANLDIPAKYGVPIAKGVPALAVLSPSGQTLYAQRTGEFENMRNMDSASVTEFLNKWKS
jgi:thiol:disulfide interchange protein